MSALYETGDFGVWTFLFLTVILGGAAAMATGRALALTWRPLWQCVLYAAPLAFTIAFLHYALFEEAVIPLEIMVEEVAGASGLGEGFRAVLWRLRGVAVEFTLFALFALAGYRLTRVRQMARQYRFAYSVASPFFWRPIG